jgi:hypothetical protein
MLQVAINDEQVEVALATGALACPACSGPLSPWGFGRSRTLRLLSGTRDLTPRRARCVGCARTHLLCPAFSVPRRRDGAEVIGEALRLAVDGEGESDGFAWLHCDGLKWPHPSLVDVGLDVA